MFARHAGNEQIKIGYVFCATPNEFASRTNTVCALCVPLGKHFVGRDFTRSYSIYNLCNLFKKNKFFVYDSLVPNFWKYFPCTDISFPIKNIIKPFLKERPRPISHFGERAYDRKNLNPTVRVQRTPYAYYCDYNFCVKITRKSNKKVVVKFQYVRIRRIFYPRKNTRRTPCKKYRVSKKKKTALKFGGTVDESLINTWLVSYYFNDTWPYVLNTEWKFWIFFQNF